MNPPMQQPQHLMIAAREDNGKYWASACRDCDKATPGSIRVGPFDTRKEAKAAAAEHRRVWQTATGEERERLVSELQTAQMQNRAEEVERGNIPVHDMEAPTPCPRCGSIYIRFKRNTAAKVTVGVLALMSSKKAHCARCKHPRYQDR